MQVWSGHPCNWHITEPVEVTDYQASTSFSAAECTFFSCISCRIKMLSYAAVLFEVQNESLGDVIGIY